MPDNVPFCVDLDGTLLRTDTLFEALLALAAKDVLALFLLPGWICKGRAFFKRQVAQRVTLDVRSLPVNREFLDYLLCERQRGRRLVLVTGADQRIAEGVAEYFGFFEEVMGSDGKVNLTGRRKAALLEKRYGRGKFDYAGNERADLPVWAAARRAVVVNARAKLAEQAGAVCEVERVFARVKSPPR